MNKPPGILTKLRNCFSALLNSMCYTLIVLIQRVHHLIRKCGRNHGRRCPNGNPYRRTDNIPGARNH